MNFNGGQVGWLAHIYMGIKWLQDQTCPATDAAPCRFVFGHYFAKKGDAKKYSKKSGELWLEEGKTLV